MPLTPRVPHGMLSSVRFSTGFFFNSRDRLRKKAGTVRCLLGNTFCLGNSQGAGGFFFFGGGGRSHGFQGERARISNRQMSTVNTGNCI